jgi:hypothetical protein
VLLIGTHRPLHVFDLQALRGFWRAHAEQLRAIPLRDTAVMDKYATYLGDVRERFEQRRQTERDWAKATFIKQRAVMMGDDHAAVFDALDEPVLKDFNFVGFEGKTLEDLAKLGEWHTVLVHAAYVCEINGVLFPACVTVSAPIHYRLRDPCCS